MYIPLSMTIDYIATIYIICRVVALFAKSAIKHVR